MKKIILLLTVCLISAVSYAQTTAKTELEDAKKEMKQSLQEAQTVIKNINWNEIGQVVNQSLSFLEKKVDVVINEVEKIDFKKIEKKAMALSNKIENDKDFKALQHTLQKTAEKVQMNIDKALPEKKNIPNIEKKAID